MTDVVLGIDIGTSGVRIAATDEKNTLKAMSAAPIAAPITDFGRAWQDPQLWWNATLAAFAALKLDGLHVPPPPAELDHGRHVLVDLGHGDGHEHLHHPVPLRPFLEQ